MDNIHLLLNSATHCSNLKDWQNIKQQTEDKMNNQQNWYIYINREHRTTSTIKPH
jgi:hypothetical protein